jgi:hypothetical protein
MRTLRLRRYAWVLWRESDVGIWGVNGTGTPGPSGMGSTKELEDGIHDEHPPARDQMRQVILQALDVFARLLLKALHPGDLRDQHVIGLIDRLSGYVGRPRETPIRHRIQRPADDVAIRCHQTLEVLGELRRAQLKPHEKGRVRTHPRSVVNAALIELLHFPIYPAIGLLSAKDMVLVKRLSESKRDSSSSW